MKSQIQKVLKGVDADYVEIRLEDSLVTNISFLGKDLDDCTQSVSYGGNVRALVKGGWGFTTFNNIDELESKVRVAIEHARSIGTRRGENLTLAEVEPVELRVAYEPINDFCAIPLVKKVEIVRGYNDLALAFDKAITTTNSRYHDKKRKIIFANSDGTYIEKEDGDLAISVSAVVRNPKGSFFGRAYNGSSNNFNIVYGLEEDVKKGCRDALEIAASEPVKGGKYTVILDPTLAGVFIHEAFGHLSEGDNVYEDPNLQQVMQLGREFGRPILNVADTGLDVGTRGHIVVDDEGVKTERTYLIKEGKLVGRLHSRETAAKMGEKPTGSARAISFMFPPIPRMRNTMIEAGDCPFDEMIRQTKDGLYCIGARGGQTNGELFTFSAADAFVVRDGKIAERVRDVTLTGNVFETLGNIDLVGNDYTLHDSGGGCGKGGQMPLPVSHGSPHIRIQNVVVGGK